MIVFDKVTVGFGEKLVLDEASFALPARKISYIIGPSGSGKSTILKVIMGFVRPRSGRVVIDGEDVTGISERQYARVRRKMGMVFQGSALFDGMTVAENVGFYPTFRERERPRVTARRVAEILKQLGLAGTEKLYPSELSGGMKRRVALARALIYQPKILLYDEPTTGLDPMSIELVDGIIREANERFDVTSVVVSHDISSVFNIADYVIFIDAGKPVEVGGKMGILTHAHPGVRRFSMGFQKLAERVHEAI
ncbi:MAG: ATP-binding cassette domain-containing protein [bacterium]|jgi:phospholipid/cholesterol/gamma-HCH transport system ATP-binding protein